MKGNDTVERRQTKGGGEIAVIGRTGDFPHFRINDLMINQESSSVENNIDCFDAAFFNYTPVEAEIMDPQIRLFHQYAWSALENAGYNPDSYEGTIGLYAGASENFEWKLKVFLSGKDKEIGLFAASQLIDRDFLCTRVSYKLNLKGPSVLIQCADSTWAESIHMACRALRDGECTMALAGEIALSYEEMRTKRAGVLVLKLLDQARRDGDCIHAIIDETDEINQWMQSPANTFDEVGVSTGFSLLVLSAQTPGALNRMTQNLVRYLKENPEVPIADIAYTLQIGRKAFAYRKMVVCRNSNDAMLRLPGAHSFHAKAEIHETPPQSTARLVERIHDNREAGSIRALLAALGQSWLHGAFIDWQSFHAGEKRYRVPLPTYPFEKQRYRITTEPESDGDFSIEPVEEREYYPLSPAQERLYVLQQLTPDFIVYNEQMAFVLEGELDQARIIDTFRTIMRRQESLRTSFRFVNDVPVQIVHAVADVPFTLEYHSTSAVNAKGIIEGFIRPFDLSRAPLMRVGLVRYAQNMYFFLLDMHHIIFDGTSIGILLAEFVACYTGKNSAELRIQYKDFSSWQNHSLKSGRIKDQEDYWLDLYSDANDIPRLNLPVDFPRPQGMTFEGKTYDFRLEKQATAAFKALTHVHDATLFMNVLAAFDVLLHQYSGQNDMIVGTGITGRSHSDLKPIIGMFVNMLPLRVRIDEEKTYRDFLKDVKDACINAYENQDLQFEDLVDKLGLERDASRNPLVDVCLAFQNFERPHVRSHELVFIPFELEKKASRFDLTVYAWEMEDGLMFQMEYYAAVFRHETIQRLAGHLIRVIHAVCLNPEIRIRDIDLVSDDEKHLLLNVFNSNSDFSTDKRIHESFEEQVEKTPGHVALLGPTSVGALREAPHQISYQELNERSDRLANELIQRGVGIDAIVAISMERSIEMIIALLGILKAGGAYLPIDADSPQERIDYILKDSGAEWLVTSAFVGADPRVCPLVPEESGAHMGAPLRNVSALPATGHRQPVTSLAYVIYTSGSTGRPKGVLINHRGFINLIDMHRNVFGETPDSRFSQVSNMGFDAMAFEIWPCLSCGGALIIIPNAVRLDPAMMKRELIRLGITVSFQPTVMAEHLLNEEWPVQGVSLNALLSAGDKINHYPQREYPFKLYNLYGPTEDTVWTTWTEVPAKPGSLASPPIGKPIINHRLYIVNSMMNAPYRLQPIGIPGEICIAGDGLARGYLNNPELTAEKFIGNQLPVAGFLNRTHNPNKSFCGGGRGAVFSKRGLHHHAPLYKTGDLGRWLDDGNIEFLGRIDYQVKIRGFRIELGEIENKLLAISGIREAVVFVKKRAEESYLCAYVVSEHEIDIPEIRRYLTSQLPGYMVPPYMIQLEKMPLTSSGKINRNALPDPSIPTHATDTAPRDWIETQLAQLWAEVLGIPNDRIGIDSNFFESGGHSLKATALISRIHHEFHILIPLGEIFRIATIREQAQYINNDINQSTAARVDGVNDIDDIEAVEEKEYYSLSYIQERIWMVCQMNPGTSAYHIPGLIEITHPLNSEIIQTVLQRLIDRHESLRTAFIHLGSGPVQIIKPTVSPILRTMDISFVDEDEKQQELERLTADEFSRPFDLSRAPLFRCLLVTKSKDHYILVFTMHHIIADGATLDILKHDFDRFYESAQTRKGEPEPASPDTSHHVTYKDFCDWYNRRLNRAGYKQDASDYWRNQLASGFPVLELPQDFNSARNGSNDRSSAIFRCFAPEPLTQGLEQLAKANHSTLFSVLFSAFGLFLSQLTGQKDVPCAIIGSGRDHVALQHVAGCFSNTIPLIIHVNPDASVSDFLHDLNRNLFKGLQYQNYPIEIVLNEMQLKYPDIPVAVNMPGAIGGFKDIKLESWEPVHRTESLEAKFELEFYIIEFANGIGFDWSYQQSVFLPETVEFFARSYVRLLEAIVSDPRRKMDACEDYHVFRVNSEKIQKHFIRPSQPFEAFKFEDIHQRIINRFEQVVDTFPDRIAVNGDHGLYTYRELHAFANAIARNLVQINPGVNRGIGLLFEHGAEMIAAMLGVLKTGNFYIPLDPTYPPGRLEYMLADSDATVILTNNRNEQFAQRLANTSKHAIRLIHIDIIDNIDDIEDIDNKNNIEELNIRPSDPTYILYTSGSTGMPKGVMQCHRNVLHFMSVYTNNLHIHHTDRLTLFSSYSFDAAVMDIYGALLNGATLYPYNIKDVGKMEAMAEWLRREAITIYHSVPTVFRFFTDGLSANDRFSSIRLIVLGGEEVLKKDIERYRAYFPDHCLFINGLGPTESTITLQNIIDKHTAFRKELVPVGYPVDRTHVYLLDETDHEVNVFGVGEIVYGSRYLALGYINKPEKTHEVFVSNPITGNGRVYRSGDFGKRLPDGSIAFIGRRDFQVKIRGYRVELSEIEGIMDQVAGITKSVVTCMTSGNSNRGIDRETLLVGYYTASDPIDETILKASLRKSLPEYMIPRVLVHIDSFPLTPTGKIDRKALPEPDVSLVMNEETFVSPADDLEEKLVDIWKGVLKLEKLGVCHSFFEIGGHSLNAMVLLSRVYKEFNVQIPLVELFKNPTVTGLAEHIRRHLQPKTSFKMIEPAEEKEYYPLTSGQKRLYILQTFETDNPAYHMPSVLVLEGTIDKHKLEDAFNALIRRHESLRTSFHMVDEEPVQRVHEEVRLEITLASGGPLFEKSGAKTFDSFHLSIAPLFRVELLKTGEKKHLLIIDIHHIITDGISQNILVRDFISLYHDDDHDNNDKDKDKELPLLRVQYKDYAEWSRGSEFQEILKKQEAYWLEMFGDDIPVLDIPVDFPRPSVQRFEGSMTQFELEAEHVQRLNAIARSERVTLFMVLLAVYNVFLAKLSGQDDVIIGTPVAGRRQPDLENVIGMFVNMLALRHDPVGEKRFLSFLKEIKENALRAFENQDYPFEDLVEHASVERDMSRNPLFDVALVFQNIFDRTMAGDIDDETIGDVNIKPYDFERGTSKFDLSLIVIERDGRLMFSFEYCTRLFKKETILRYMTYFRTIVTNVSSILDDPGKTIFEIEMLPEEEKDRLLHTFNDTDADYPKDQTIHELFDEQVTKGPDHVAVKETRHAASLQLTYNELKERSNQLAVELVKKGVQPDTIVAMTMTRSMEMIVSILGILKAGGVYLPIDPDYPQDRIDYMLKDSGAQLVINEHLVGADPCVCPRSINKKWGAHAGAPLHSNLAYVIYTSGTTGKPKGSLITHQNVVRLMINDKFPFEFSNRDIWTLFHSYCFDFSVWEMYGALLYGGKLIIIPLLTAKDPGQYLKILKRECVTVLNQTPAAFDSLSQKEMACPSSGLHIRYVIFGGEALNPAKLAEWKKKYPQTLLINMFGITETTVHVTFKKIDETDIQTGVSNIGKPIPTLKLYIMDRGGNLVPIGVSGELVVGGDGVARGYLNRPELTNNKFVTPPPKLTQTKRFCPAFYKKRAAGGMLYQSGDLGRYLTDGDIEYLGRMDHQVKVRGFRIELGEIESRLLKKKEIKDTVVLAREDEPGSKSLCAYIVFNGFNPSLTLTEIRDYLSAELPGYMVPSYIVVLDKMPLTSNGKIDRKSLPAPVQENVMTESDDAAPRNRVEEILVEIWKKALKREKVGIRDSYFHLGGDSMKAINVLNRINHALGSALTIADLFTAETIETLAVTISEKHHDPNDINVHSHDHSFKDAVNEIENLKSRVLEKITTPVEFIDDIYPMSDIEKGMAYHSLKNPNDAVYHDQMVSRLAYRDFDPNRLKRALELMVEKHSILRTAFNMGDFGEAVQIVYRECPLDYIHDDICYDMSQMDQRSQENHIREFLDNDRRQPFDLSQAPLWRMRTFRVDNGDNDHTILLWIFHHAIIDGWSNASFKTELNNIYLKLGTDPDFVPEKLKSSYRDFVVEQTAYKKNQELRDYWNQELEDYRRLHFGTLNTSYEEQGKSAKSKKTKKSFRLDLGIERMNRLHRVAERFNSRLKHLCFAAYMYMLNMASFDHDITAGLVTNNRPLREDGEKILGCFLNSVPVRLKIPDTLTWSEYIRMVDSKIIALSNVDRLSLFEIALLIGETTSDRNPIFDVLFNYVDFYVYGDAVAEEETAHTDLAAGGYENTNTLFDLTVSTTGGHFRASVSYSNELLTDETARALLQYFEEVLDRFVDEPEGLASKNDLISSEEKQKILDQFNRNESAYPTDKTMHGLFEEQVIKGPDRIAVIGTIGTSILTYNELNKQSHALTLVLKEKGVSIGSIVAISMERSMEMIIGILGILKAGAAYLPLNPNQPKSRTEFMLKDSGANTVLGSNLILAEWGAHTGAPLRKPVGADPCVCPSAPIGTGLETQVSNIAYIIYTSGSTGQPKGVPITHANISPLLHWGYTLGINKTDRVIQNLSYYFDWSVWEIFITLTTCASLFMIPEPMASNPEAETDFIISRGITVLHATPTQYGYLLKTGQKLHSLRYLFLGAEKLTESILRQSIDSVDPSCRLFNMYGPTEATIIAAALEIDRNTVDDGNHYKPLASIPIGTPMANTILLVLDGYMNLCPVGITGELVITGSGTASGYLNNPELTKERFSTFLKKGGAKNFWYKRSCKTFYKTGDLCRWLNDGNIEFLGRIDHQVKIRGFRIETGEIECRLLDHPEIKDAVVIAKESNHADHYLCAYVVPRSSQWEFSPPELREHLSEKLPEYMIPSYFMALENLPLTPNGKINRDALPDPVIEAQSDYQAPETDIEKQLVRIWADVLGIDESIIGIDAGFLELGGHSLKATVLISRIHKEMNVKISLGEIFKYQTIRNLANYIDQIYKINSLREADVPISEDSEYDDLEI
ncbi:MAG: amino acid adenylation domain-containing protein [Candidatus Omnitrophota bacterium]